LHLALVLIALIQRSQQRFKVVLEHSVAHQEPEHQVAEQPAALVVALVQHQPQLPKG
jgi:hypothetical protein